MKKKLFYVFSAMYIQFNMLRCQQGFKLVICCYELLFASSRLGYINSLSRND